MRSAIIIISILLAGVTWSQNQETIESEADKEIQEVKTQPDAVRVETKAKKKSIRQKSKAESNVSVDIQKFKLVESSANVQRTRRSPSAVQQAQMNAVVSSLENNSPNSFEYHYFKYLSGNYDISLISHLNQAEKKRPNNVDVLVQKAAYNIIINDTKKALSYLDKVYASEKLSKNVVSYSTDILRSVPLNGTLITHGFDDTYGVFYAQKKMNVRSDVQLISLELLQSDVYRAALKKKGYSLPSSKFIDTKYLLDFCKMNVIKQITVSLTTPKEYLKPIAKKLYVTGLVMVYTDNQRDNFMENEILWQTKLKKTIIENAKDEKAKQLSANYLPILFILRKGYHLSGDIQKVKEIDKVIDNISIQCRKYEQVQKLKSSY